MVCFYNFTAIIYILGPGWEEGGEREMGQGRIWEWGEDYGNGERTGEEGEDMGVGRGGGNMEEGEDMGMGRGQLEHLLHLDSV